VNAAAAQLAAQLILVRHRLTGQHFANYIEALDIHLVAPIPCAGKSKARSAGRKPRLNKYTADLYKYASNLLTETVTCGLTPASACLIKEFVAQPH
jgi:hypothetical protein